MSRVRFRQTLDFSKTLDEREADRKRKVKEAGLNFVSIIDKRLIEIEEFLFKNDFLSNQLTVKTRVKVRIVANGS
jgi:hypothetical protein